MALNFKPDVRKLCDDIDGQRVKAGEAPMDRGVRMQVLNDVAATLQHIESSPALSLAYGSLSEQEINEGVKHYARELLRGRKFPDKDPFLTELLTMNPVVIHSLDDSTSTAGKQPPVKNTPQSKPQPLSHLLRDPDCMAIFRQEVLSLTQAPGNPGHQPALWIKKMMESPRVGEEQVIRMFESMRVLAQVNERDRASGISNNQAALKGFVSSLTAPQKALFKEVFMPKSDRGIISSTIRPDSIGGHTRRAFLLGGAATVLGLKAHSDYEKGNEMVRKSVSTSPTVEDKPQGEDDLFRRKRATATVNNPENVGMREEAEKWKTQGKIIAGVAAVPAVGTLIDGGYVVVKGINAMRKDKFREQVREMLTNMDHVVSAVKGEIVQRNAVPPHS